MAGKQKKPSKSLKTTLTLTLMAPVAVCAASAIIFFISGDQEHALILLGITLMMGIFNALIVKVLLPRLEQGAGANHNDQGDAS